MASSYSSRIHDRQFDIGDLVLRKVMLNTRDHTPGTLGLNWEGTYHIAQFISPRMYKLGRLNDHVIP